MITQLRPNFPPSNFAEVEFIACAVQSAQDVRDIRKLMGDRGAGIKIIAKIGSMSAVDNLDEILAESDGVMVVRGDLGVMVREEQVFVAQKMIIARCNAVHKPAIIATQMLYDDDSFFLYLFLLR